MAKDMDSFRFSEASVDEAQIRSLYEGGFLQDHSNLIFVGGGSNTGPPETIAQEGVLLKTFILGGWVNFRF